MVEVTSIVSSEHPNPGWRALAIPPAAVLIWMLANLEAVVIVVHFLFPSDATFEHLRRVTLVRRAWMGSWIFALTCYGIFAIFLLAALRKRSQSLADCFGRFRREYLFLGIAIGAVLSCASGGAQLLLMRHLDGSSGAIHGSSASEWAATLTGLPLAFVVAPFVEELYFRGVVLRWLQNRMPASWSVIISAAGFVLLHIPKMNALTGLTITGTAFIVGVVAGIGAIRTRSLWFSVMLHASYNVSLWSFASAWLLQLI